MRSASLTSWVKERVRHVYAPVVRDSPTLTVLTLLAQPRHRTRETSWVEDGYDQHWGEYRAWLDKARTLDDWLYIRGNDDAIRTHQFEGRLRKQAFDWAAYHTSLIFDAVEKYFPGARSIAEYGCGVGRNVLRAKLRFPYMQCFGYELSREGTRIANDAARKFGIDAKFAPLDYVNAGPDEYVFGKTDIAFTMFSLEQIPFTNMIGLKNMLDHASMGSIHIEPVCENYPWSYRGVLGRIFVRRLDYLRNFDAGVRALPVTLAKKEILRTSHNPLMYPSLYVLKHTRENGAARARSQASV
jgi:hypothetical protein